LNDIPVSLVCYLDTEINFLVTITELFLAGWLLIMTFLVRFVESSVISCYFGGDVHQSCS